MGDGYGTGDELKMGMWLDVSMRLETSMRHGRQDGTWETGWDMRYGMGDDMRDKRLERRLETEHKRRDRRLKIVMETRNNLEVCLFPSNKAKLMVKPTSKA